MKLIGIACVLFALALGVAACGGVEESTSSGGGWTTIAKTSWDGTGDASSVVNSQPFHASGQTRFVLDMPGAEATDGVTAMVVPAAKANDPMYMNGESVVMNQTFNTDEANLPDGDYVLQFAMPGLQKFTVAIQKKD